MSTDRLNAATVEETSSVSLLKSTTQTPTIITPANTPEVVSPPLIPNTLSSPDSIFSPDKPSSTSTSTRRGRRVRLPQRFTNYCLY